MSDIKLGVMIPARQEGKILYKTLKHLMNQSLRPKQVLVVNDNSTDDTKRIALLHGCQVIDFPYEHDNWVTDFKLATVKNFGFKELNDDLDYIMILGADHVLPIDYIKTIVQRMRQRPKLVVASGMIRNEWTVAPRGSGRIISMAFWKLYGKCYPLNWGYESHILYKALTMGYEIEQFNDIVTDTQRQTTETYKPIMYFHYGKAMQALGYSPLYAMGRCMVITKRKGIKSGFNMWQGFSSNHVTKYEPELRRYVKQEHKLKPRHIKRLIRYFIRA